MCIFMEQGSIKRHQVSHTEYTSHSAYDATSTESNRVKIDGFIYYPNLM